ncbi:phage portal protein [Nocardia speluncae]|uniref:phage portal protein n=1 Tax=Nocardia speluncae TaxID=419477 RepID=UPI001FDEB857|nr:phage portal protein [Nocardia speluncae]
MELYSAGEQPLTFLAPEIRAALNNRLSRVSIGVPRMLVDALAERLRLTGFDDLSVWDLFLQNDMDQLSGVVHREALTLGNSYVTVWDKITVETAHQMVTMEDPGTRETVAGFKRWETDKTTEGVLYLPNTIVRLRANQTGATTQGFEVVDELENPLGVVPVVRFKNSDRLLGEGVSAMEPVLSLTDALTKLTTDMLTSSEYSARPRRWATGVELAERDVLDDEGNPTGETEAVNPFGENDRMMISEAADSKFGQLQGADLAAYQNAINVIMRQISAVSGLPEHMLGIGGDNPTSADAMRSSESALTAKAEAKQSQFGRSWEQVARLAIAARDGVDPASVSVSAQWADPATRSVAQEADAVVKLFSAGLLSQRFALKRLGYSDAEVREIIAN